VSGRAGNVVAAASLKSLYRKSTSESRAATLAATRQAAVAAPLTHLSILDKNCASWLRSKHCLECSLVAMPAAMQERVVMASKVRRKFSPEQKAQLVIEILTGKRSVAEIARKEQIKDSMLYEWRAAFLRNAPQVFTAASPDRAQEERMAELEQVIGRLTIENDALKKASRWLNGISARSGS
jgi:transposase